LTNGSALDNRLKQASQHLLPIATKDPTAFITDIYQHSFCRKPTEAETKIALEMLDEKPKAENVADFLWAISMLPEFQLIN
jgi:hypothetical protein